MSVFDDKLKQSIDNIADVNPELPEGINDIIKSLPEEKRMAMFDTFYEEKKTMSPRSLWNDIASSKTKVLNGVFVIIVVIFIIIGFSQSQIQELMQQIMSIN